MINFLRQETNVIAEIECNSTVAKRWLSFSWNTTSELVAQLFVDNLENHLSERLQMERRKAYLAGWKDAKAKRKRETWFSGSL